MEKIGIRLPVFVIFFILECSAQFESPILVISFSIPMGAFWISERAFSISDIDFSNRKMPFPISKIEFSILDRVFCIREMEISNIKLPISIPEIAFCVSEMDFSISDMENSLIKQR